MKMTGAKSVRELVDAAEVISKSHVSTPVKPRLLVELESPDRTVHALRDILAKDGHLYDRGVPVRLVYDPVHKATVAQALTPHLTVLTAHTACRPFAFKIKRDGTVSEKDVKLPLDFAKMYLDARGEWDLLPFNGIATAPLLLDDGGIRSVAGYDPSTGMWAENMPALAGLVPDRPNDLEAAAALQVIRETFKTFCFADAVMRNDGGANVVDTRFAPAQDESSFLAGLLTAVCRPSLLLAPGLLLRAPAVSGAGSGKGLAARCICIIAFGREPHAVTGGSTNEELEKRIAAELIEGHPSLFLDNLNNTAFKSDLLASAITERPARVRVLGRSLMVPLNSAAFVVLTGNGLTVSEDLARRFITVDFDARVEDAESRTFKGDIRREVVTRRVDLLAALLTIWRWGRQSEALVAGQPMGSFEQWCRWVRDPLLALGCADPAVRLTEAKQRDVRRQTLNELFTAWTKCHSDKPVCLRDVDERVREIADPQGRGRQFLAARLEQLVGTRVAGFVLTRQLPVGRWGVATYALCSAEAPVHGGHRALPNPEPPMPPMVDGEERETVEAVARMKWAGRV